MSDSKKVNSVQNLEEALQKYQEIQRQEPDNLDALQGMARAYYRLKRDNESINCCTQALTKNKTLVWPHLVQSYVYYRQKRMDECKKEAEVAIEAAPSDWEANFWWGTLLVDKNKIDEGLVFLEKAVSMESNNLYLYNNLATAYQKKGDLKKYHYVLTQMNRLRPSFIGSLLLYLGNVATHAIWVLLIHYLLILLALMFKLQLL